MRMWNLPPQILCRQHFLGEHNELHKFVGALNHNRNITTYIQKGYFEIHNIRKRHEELVLDFPRRHYNHNSPLPDFPVTMAGKIDIHFNLCDLVSRCQRCREQFTAIYQTDTLILDDILIPNRSTTMSKRRQKKQKPASIGEGLLSIANGDFLRPNKKKSNGDK